MNCVDLLRRIYIKSAKHRIEIAPVYYKIASMSDSIDGWTWATVKCSGCNSRINAAGHAVYVGEDNILSGRESWAYLCSECCSRDDLEHIDYCMHLIDEFQLTGVNALIVMWGGFDKIPADMLL